MALSFFAIPPSDQSIYFLNQIFGNVGTVLGGSATNPLLGTLFLTINTIALTVGSIIVVYTTVVGLMNTAVEGEFLGKNWNSLWVPIRMVLGVASLFPAASGYSMIQILFMWIIVQSVGAADTLWTAAVNFSKSSVAYASQANSGAYVIGLNSTLGNLFQGLVCEATSKKSVPGFANTAEVVLQNANFQDATFNTDSTTYGLGQDGSCGQLVKCSQSAACGVNNENKNTDACIICTAQNTVLGNTIIPQLRTVAQIFADADAQYIAFYELANKPSGTLACTSEAKGWITNYCKAKSLEVAPTNATCCVPPAASSTNNCCQPADPSNTIRAFPALYDTTMPGVVANGMTKDENTWAQQWYIFPTLAGTDPSQGLDKTKVNYNAVNFIQINATVYTNAITAAAASINTNNVPTASSSTSEYTPQDAINNGWITAGAYFYQLVHAASQSLQTSNMTLSVNPPDNQYVQNPQYRSNYAAAGEFVSVLTDGSNAQNANNPSIPGAAGSGINSALNDVKGTLSVTFMNMLRGAAAVHNGVHDSALLRMATFGQNLLIIAQLFYVVVMAGAATFAALAALGSIVVFGNGNITAGLEAYKAINALLLPALFLLLGALMTMGALLGMYVPMIPFVVFTASVIGWFIAVIEAMVAAPIVALGILSPGGQSQVFGRAEHSITIIFNLFLRPTLMVFGLLVASALADVVVQVICQGFQYVLRDVMTLSPGLVEQVIFIAIFTSLIFTSMNQVFTLIHHIPEKILTYIGGHALQYGESQAAQAMKHAVDAAAGGMAAAGKGTAEGAVKVGTAVAKKAEKVGGEDTNDIGMT